MSLPSAAAAMAEPARDGPRRTLNVSMPEERR